MQVAVLTKVLPLADTLRRMFLSLITAIKPLLTPFAFPLFAVLTANWLDWRDSRNIEQALLRLQNYIFHEDKDYFTREDIVRRLHAVITPSYIRSSKYVIITGEHGNGKTSLIKYIVSKQKSGVIYLSCPSNYLRFGEIFADAISYSAIYHPSVIRQAFQASSLLSSPMRFRGYMPVFEACLNKFIGAVKNYKKRTGLIPVLIIDAINRLVVNKDGASFLIELQQLAKDWTDMGLVKVIFLTSEGRGLYIMQQQPVMTRAEVLSIPDLTETEALACLTKLCGQEHFDKYKQEDILQVLRNIVGGRIMMLKGLAELMKHGGALDRFCNYALKFASQKFFNCGLFISETALYNKSRAIAVSILKSPLRRIPDREVRHILGSPDVYSLLRDSNFFHYCDQDASILFASNACATFAAQEFVEYL